MSAKKWGPGIPDLKSQKFFDFGELGAVEANEYKEKENADASTLDDKYTAISGGALGYRTIDDNKKPDAPDAYSVHQSRPVLLAIRAISIAIAAAAAIVSGTNSFEYFRNLRPTGISFLMAFTLVGSGAILPDISIYLSRIHHRIAGVFVLLCGVLAISFCMVTTLAALYNTRSARTATAYSDSSAIDAQNKASISAKAEADRIRAELVQTNSLISSTQGKIDSIPTDQTLSDNSQVLQGRLNAYLKDKRKYEDRLTVLQSIQDRPIDGSKVRRSDFYAFISGVLHINDPDKVEFFTGAIPSVFLEVITPIMLAVALFL